MTIPAQLSVTAANSALHYKVTHGKDTGAVLRPLVRDGKYVVSHTKNKRDYVLVPLDEPLEPYLQRGFHLRMDAPNYPASLIAPASILGRTPSAAL